MNIDELVHLIQQSAAEITSSCCVINGAIMNLNEVEKMGCQEFGIRSKINMPSKLYKYFPNSIKEDDSGKEIDYSMQALKNNTVFMQAPNEFDDVYDSDINIDYTEYERLRLIEYCHRCKIEVMDTFSTQEIGNLFLQALQASFNSTGGCESVFTKKEDSQLERLSNEYFCLRLTQEVISANDLGLALARVISSDYEDYCTKLKNTFRTSCFATTPYSQLMWGGSYADCHRGFCVEYTILPNDDKYKEIYQNLFPMIYCKTRPNMTERLIKVQDKDITVDGLWDIYSHGALRKSIDWAFQNEWRLLLPMGKQQPLDYNVRFFPIAKVFLGNRMSPEKRYEIIKLCKERSIPYVGVMRNPNIFEMQDCGIKCEDCIKYKNGLDSAGIKI